MYQLSRYIMKINKAKIKAARILEEKKLAKLLSEAKTLNHLAESKSTQQIKLVYVNEIKRLVHNIKSFYLFEFVVRELSDAISALHDIMIKNEGNEIGRYLSTLTSVEQDAGKTAAEMIAKSSQIKAAAPLRGRIQRSGPAAAPSLGSGGFSEAQELKEAIKEGLLDSLKGLFKGKKSEPVQLRPTSVIDPFTGEEVGFGGQAPALSDRGKVANYQNLIAQLTDMANEEEPKIIAFATAYYSLFDFFAEGQPLQIMIKKVGLTGETKLENVIKKTFGKIKGFNTKVFAKQIAEDESIIRINLQLNQKHGVALTNVSMEFEKVPMKGILGQAADWLSGAGYGGAPKGGVGAMRESKKTFKK